MLLIFKYFKTRENGSLDLKVLKRNIHKIKKYQKTNKPQQTRKTQKFWTKMETIVRKHITRILKYMLVQQLGWERGNVVYLAQYDISFYTSCVFTAVLKTDA